ncbi:MAG TPA: protein kinase, partial [Humisphaera sp.]
DGGDGPPSDAYRIIRVVGEGGMGTVYEAEQTNPRRRVAIKAIRADLPTPQARRRFEYEAQVLARLEHPGIARLYEADIRPGASRARGYLVMEFVDGVPVDEHVRKAGLDLRGRLELFLRICEPVAYAHRMGVIHRDLKPANILVNADGQPKVLDFGVARTVDPGATVGGGGGTGVGSGLTTAGQIVGTLAYMSPEQFDGGAAVDTRTDVYALGVVLHQVLTGRHPIDLAGAGLGSAAHRLMNVVPDPIGRHDRRLRGDLEVIVGRALEKDPGRRYASVEQLAAEVRRHLAGEPIEARADSAAYVLRRAAWRHRRWVAGFAAVLAGVSAFAVYASVQSKRSARLAADAAAARDEAGRARTVAEQRADDYRHSLYAANVAFARVSLDDREVVQLRRALDACDPDLRGWEWYHLDRQADRADRTIDPGDVRAVTVDTDADLRVVAFGLPAGRYRVVSAADGRDVLAGKLGDGREAPTERTKVAVSPAGDLVVAMTGGEIVARALPGGRELWRAKRPPAPENDLVGSNHVRVSPDGKLVAASDAAGVTLLRAADGSPAGRVADVKNLMTFEFAPDSAAVAVGERSGRIRTLALDGRPLVDFPGYGPIVHRLGFSRDGGLLAAGNYTGRAMIWDARTGELRTSALRTDGGGVRKFSFSPNAATVYVAGDDRLIRAIDVKTGVLRDVYAGHADGVWLAELDPTGTRLLSVGRENVIKLWPVPLPPAGPLLGGGAVEPAGVAFAADSGTVYSAGADGKVRAWDRRLPPGAPPATIGFDRTAIVALAADRAGARLVTGNADGGVRAWDPAAHAVLWEATCPGGRATAVAFAPGEARVLTGDAAGNLRAWDAATGARSGGPAAPAHAKAINAIAVHPDGKSVATAGGDGMIRTWRWPELTPLAEAKADARAVTSIAFSPDGRWLAACGETRSSVLRDARTLAVVHVLTGTSGGTRGVAFAPDGRRLVTCGNDGTARVWDVVRVRELLALRCGTAIVQRAAFSPDGRTIATAEANGALRLWAGPADGLAPSTRPAATQPATTRPASSPAAATQPETAPHDPVR